ncbi:MAG: hypothetical protein AB7O96_07715 [Pseudobdellovibrionaceae bacterium]
MNLRQFSIALLISALPVFASANPSITFNKGDFVSANSISRNGETVLSIKLSKSGKAKVKKLNQISAAQNIHAEIGGVVSDFSLREPIVGDSLEMGPYSTEDAHKVVTEINRQK